MKQKRSSNSSKVFGCCENVKFISQPDTRRDVLVRNPQNVHFAKKIIVGNQFRQLLKALYKNHSKDAQAIKRKISKGYFQRPESKGEDDDDKVSIYNIEGGSEASKNKTIIKLRAAILKLLDKVVKKAKSTRNAKRREQNQNLSSKVPEKNNFSKTAKTEIQESYEGTSPASLDKDEDLSAKRANYLDLLNFIARMKSSEIGREVDSRHKNRLPSMDAGMLDARDMMSEGPFRPVSQIPEFEKAQNENGYLPGNGVQIQEMNLAEQRKLIEDQMENHLAQLQLKTKLLENQQDLPPTQTLRNIQMSNLMRGLQNPIATQPEGAIPFGIRRQPIFQQPLFIPRVNPYLPFVRPHPRFRTGLPFLHPIRPRVRFPLDNEDEDDDDDVEEDDNDYDRDEPPPHQLREFEDTDNDYADEEHNDSENDER